MSVMNKAPVNGAAQKQGKHKKMVGIRVDARTLIEVPADLTEEQRQKRVDDFMKNREQKFVR